VITTPEDRPSFEKLLGDGSQFGVSITYALQPRPEGLAQAYLIGEDFVAGEPSVMILGDNIFYGHGLPDLLARADARTDGATVFGYRVSDPERYGVVAFGPDRRATDIEEKPRHPKSNYAVTGLYFYDGRASALARTIKPSHRGELEITSLNQIYLEEGGLTVELMGRGYAWLDTGTFDSMLEASEFVKVVQHRQGMQICCPEEIAFAHGWVSAQELVSRYVARSNNPYYAYILSLAEREA
jgi:glucose-1-phosphate thymidylyltransferase